LKLTVTVKAGAKQERIERLDETHYRVWVKAPPLEGRANEAVVEALSDYFDKPKSFFEILSGHHSKNKIISVSLPAGK